MLVPLWKSVPTVIKRLLGMQPTLTHVPPITVPLVAFSPIIAVFTPRLSALIAAANAAEPCPMITSSYSFVSDHLSSTSQVKRLLA